MGLWSGIGHMAVMERKGGIRLFQTLFVSILLDALEYGAGYVGGGFGAARSEAGPVIEVDNLYVARFGDYAVAAVYLHVKQLGSAVAYVAELRQVEWQVVALTVDFLIAVLAVSVVKGIEPVEKRRALYAVELDEVRRDDG